MPLNHGSRWRGTRFFPAARIFFRPGASGTDQAVQYTPGLNGANAWQIYTGPGYTAVAEIPRKQWIHVRIVVAGLVAKLYLNNSPEPVLTVPDNSW